jgi:hypothetical protein
MLLVTEMPPPLAVMVTVAEARGAVVADFNVRVDEAWPAEPLGVSGLALQVAETPAGNPLIERLTAVVKVPEVEIVIVLVAVLPFSMLNAAAVADIASELGRVTVSAAWAVAL